MHALQHKALEEELIFEGHAWFTLRLEVNFDVARGGLGPKHMDALGGHEGVGI